MAVIATQPGPPGEGSLAHSHVVPTDAGGSDVLGIPDFDEPMA